MIKNKYAIYKRSKHNECVSTQDRVLRLLYGNRAGRMVLGSLIRPEVSKLVGRFMDTGLSRIMINPFIKKNDIDISVCQKNEFDSYNDFFKRKPSQSRIRSPAPPRGGSFSAVTGQLQ